MPFPPLVFPDSAKAGLNFHSDQAHLFGECPGETSQSEKVLLMIFFDHTIVAVSPRVSRKEGIRPPGFKVCGDTGILNHGDAIHATSLPDEYGGEKRGMQLRGWTLKPDMENFLEARTLGRGGGQRTPN